MRSGAYMQVNLRKLAGGLSAVLMIATGVTAIAPTVAATASSSTSFADATAYGMNAGHTGVSSDPVGPDWAVKWSKTEGGAVDYPVIANGEVVVLAGGSAPTLTAYAASTGDQLWQDAVATASLGMTYQSGRVFVQSGGFSAVMSAYDITTGNLDWSASIPGQYSFSSAPTAANGIVYTDGAGSGGTLYAFNQNNGALLWTGEVTNGDDSSPAVDANGVYASFACDLTQAFNASSGTPLWTHEFACEGGGGQTAVLADGDVFLRDLILNASTGAIVRSFRSGPTPAVDNQYAYAEASGTLRASTIGSGSVLWSQAADGGLDTAPIEVNGVVYDGSSTGHVYGFSALTGQQVAKLTLGTPVQPSGTDSTWGLAEGDGLLAVPAGNTITIFGQSGIAPSAPAEISATAGAAQATVNWTVPADNGNPITDYTITPFVAGVAQTPLVVAAGTAGSATDPTPGASDQATVPDLTDGTSYTFTVQADNRAGPGTASDPTSTIIPAGSTTPPSLRPSVDATAYGMNAGHTGISSDPVGPDWSVKWSKTEGGAVDYPVIANGEVVVLAGGSAPALTAYDANTGDQLWQDAVATASLGMTYQSGRVFVQSGGSSALMSAYDITTGNLDWSASIPGQYSFSSAPTAANGIVYTDGAGEGGTLYAFNQSTGALLWTGEVTNGDDSSPAEDANGVYASFACDLT
ncbi:MAG TPA: PQQ-binding-like beta-propeller repeat protein [Acidimicrobiales bacterium]|nr:PQQ-binding-like beta-propeller repeat protein [Acidimicrobiales bacterium]